MPACTNLPAEQAGNFNNNNVILSVCYFSILEHIAHSRVTPQNNVTHKYANNLCMFSANYFILGAHQLQFVHEHSKKLQVFRSNIACSLPNDPLGVAGTSASGMRNCQ